MVRAGQGPHSHSHAPKKSDDGSPPPVTRKSAKAARAAPAPESSLLGLLPKKLGAGGFLNLVHMLRACGNGKNVSLTRAYIESRMDENDCN